MEVIPDDMKEYVAGDSYYCLAVWDKMKDFWPEDERECWLNTCIMGWRGVPTSRQYLLDGLEKLHQAQEEYKEAIPLEKKLSIPQLRRACEELNIPAPETTSKASELFTDWLEEYGHLVPWVTLIGKYRSVNRMISITERMLSRVYTDHEGIERLPYTLTYCGASTAVGLPGATSSTCNSLTVKTFWALTSATPFKHPKGISSWYVTGLGLKHV